MRALRGVFTAALLFSGHARATEADRPFRLKYDAPSDCPSADDVSARIRASTAHARPAVGDELRYDMTLVISRAETGYLASLGVRLPDGSTTARSVPAPSCGEAVDAAALILAITIDPEASAPNSARLGTEAPTTPTPEPETAKPSEPTPTKSETPAPRPPLAGPDFDRPAPRPSLDRLLLDAGTGFVAFAIAPGLAPDFSAGVAYEPTVGSEAPRFGLSFHFARGFPVKTADGTASFERIGGRLDACPFRGGSRTVNVRPCFLFELGRLLAQGYDTTDGRDAPILWSAAGAFLSGELRASDSWAGRAELGALFPFRRDEFYFGPNNSNVHSIPPVGAFVALALELQIL